MTKAQNLAVRAGLSVALALSVSWTAAAKVAPGNFYVRVFLQGYKHFPTPCSQITVVVKLLWPFGPPDIYAVSATGPDYAPVGQCTAFFVVPEGLSVEVSATYLGLISKPHPSYPPPNGNWSNPFKVNPLANPTRYLLIYGKP